MEIQPIDQHRYVIRSAQADITRALNNIGINVFDTISKNPIMKSVQPPYNTDSIVGIDYVDGNINVARDMIRYRLNSFLNNHFQHDRFTSNEFSVNIAEKNPISHWKNINVTILSASPDKMNQGGPKKYRCYVIFSVDLPLELKHLKSKKIYTTDSTISTIIQSRFLALQHLTNDFENHLLGKEGFLDVYALIGTMGLTWMRGYLQYATMKPLNIVSTEWLEIITNAAILMQEYEVFRSVDPLSIAHTGYETAKTLINEFGGTKKQTFTDYFQSQNKNEFLDISQLSTQFETKYNEKNTQNKSLEETLDNIDNTITVDSRDLCNNTFLHIIGKNNTILKNIIQSVYHATFEINANSGSIVENNWQNIKQKEQHQINKSKTLEENNKSKAYRHLHETYPSFTIKHIECNHKKTQMFNYQYNKDDHWYFVSKKIIPPISTAVNVSNPNHIILRKEKYELEKMKLFSSFWQIKTTWNITLASTIHPANEKTIHLDFFSKKYSFTMNHIIKEKPILVTYTSSSYSSKNPNLGLISPSHNDINSPFQLSRYERNNHCKSKIDQNLEGLFALYVENISEQDIIKILMNPSTGEYKKSFSAQFINDKGILYPKWLLEEITFELLKFRNIITREVQVNKTDNIKTKQEYDFTNQITTLQERLLDKYNSENCKGVLNQYLKKFYQFHNGETIFKDTASKTIYYCLSLFMKSIEESLSEDLTEPIVRNINNAIEDAGSDSSCNEMQTDTTKAQQLINTNSFPIPNYIADNITLFFTEGSNYFQTWQENITCMVKQNPSYLSVDTYKNLTGYNQDNQPFGPRYIKYSNTCLFSPSSSFDSVIDNGFKELNTQLLDAINYGFDTLKTIQHDANLQISNQKRNIILQNLQDVSTVIVTRLKQNNDLQENIWMHMGNLLKTYFSKSSVEQNINQVLSSYFVMCSMDRYIIENLTDSKKQPAQIKQDIIQELKNSLPSHISVDTKRILHKTIRITVNEGYNKGVSSILKSPTVKMKLIGDKEQNKNGVFEAISNEVTTELQKKLSLQMKNGLTKAVSSIPSGLPLLPPFGWFLTINAWIIEVEGDIPQFILIDQNNDAKSHPLFGHQHLEFIRTNQEVQLDIDNNKSTIKTTCGVNTPIHFRYTTGSFIIVPPGQTGVGDRIGGFTEIKKCTDE